MPGATCESLKQFHLPAGTTTLAQVVNAGEFEPPSGDREGFGRLPAFCRALYNANEFVIIY